MPSEGTNITTNSGVESSWHLVRSPSHLAGRALLFGAARVGHTLRERAPWKTTLDMDWAAHYRCCVLLHCLETRGISKSGLSPWACPAKGG
jgi:hypothetical protein